MIDAQTVNQSQVPADTRYKFLGAGVSALLAIVCYGLFLTRGVSPSVVGYNLVPSERILAGDVPYRDFLYNYTPGVLWLNALLFKLFGTSLMTARAGVYLAKILSAVLLYLIATRYLNKYLAPVPVLMMLAWIGYGDLLKIFPTQYGMPLLLAAWLCMLKAFEASASRSTITWMAASGTFAGLVFIFKQNVGVFSVAAACVSALILPPQNGRKLAVAGAIAAIKRAVIVALGFAVPVTVMAVYLASRHALIPMLSHFMRHAAAYEEAKGIALPKPGVLLISVGLALITAAVALAIRRVSPIAATAWLALVFWGLLMMVTSTGVRGGRVESLYQSLTAEVYYLPIYTAVAGLVVYLKAGKLRRPARLLVGVLFAIGAFLEIVPRSDADHLARVLPASFVLACALLTRAVSNSYQKESSIRDRGVAGATRERSPLFQSPKVVFAGLCLLVIFLGIRVTWAPQFDRAFNFRDSQPLTFARGSGVRDTPSEVAMLNDLVAYVQTSTGPDDQILGISRRITCIYFFSARPNTTRLEWFDSPGVPAVDREDIYTRVSARKFKLIVFGEDLAEMTGGDKDKNDISRYQERLLSLLPGNYNKAAVIDGVTCFAPR